MLSVITPVYNGERFMEFCIKNVIEQNCPHVEHVIIDGNSTDNTVNIIKNYAKKYDHIRWISEKDTGQSDAQNKGIKMARGGIISFLNVDDFYEPHTLNRVLEIFKTLPEPSLLVGNCNIWGDEGKIMYVNKPKSLKLTDLLSSRCPFPYNPSAYFCHKSLHQKMGLYDVNEHYMADLDFIIRAIQVANVKYIDETLGNNRYIKGTKTVALHEANLHKAHYRSLMEKHIKKLPLLKQFIIIVKYFIFVECKHKVIFFLKVPYKFFHRQKGKEKLY